MLTILIKPFHISFVQKKKRERAGDLTGEDDDILVCVKYNSVDIRI